MFGVLFATVIGLEAILYAERVSWTESHMAVKKVSISLDLGVSTSIRGGVE